MKKIITLMMGALAVLSAGTARAEQPESFTARFLQEDYRTVTENGEQVSKLVRQHYVNVEWDKENGIFTFHNFYNNSLVNDGQVDLIIPIAATSTNSPTTITWESDTKASFTWRAFYMGQSDILANLPFSYSSFKSYKNAVVCKMQRVSSPVRIYDPEANTINSTSYYGYDGGKDALGTIDLEAGVIEITSPWGCVVGNNTWTNMSNSIVIEYFERSVLTKNKTDIKTVGATATPVRTRYYNYLGVESATPFSGLNIVVTEFDNGARTTSKVLK